MRFRLAASLLISSAVTAAGVGAQSPARIPYLTYIAVNPLGIPFDIASAEFETALASGITVGALGSYTSLGDDRYTTFDAKVRYYPGEVVLDGFSLGASVGRTHFSTRANGPTGSARQTLDYPTLGLLVDYNWMLGRRRRFIVGGGIGAKRVLAGQEDRGRVGLDRAYATARFVVGIAF